MLHEVVGLTSRAFLKQPAVLYRANIQSPYGDFVLSQDENYREALMTSKDYSRMQITKLAFHSRHSSFEQKC